METLEVGQFVRTKDGIKQIYEIDSNKTKWKYLYKLRHQDEDGTIDLGMLCDDDIIGEPSYNPIDLIEAGDYVNGKLVTDIEIHCCDGIDEEDGSKCLFFKNEVYGIYNQDIKTILTKEQFENNCFRIGE